MAARAWYYSVAPHKRRERHNGMTSLTTAQREILSRYALTDTEQQDCVNARFMADRQAWDIDTGVGAGVSTNVMYQPVYWTMPRVLAHAIAKMTGTRLQAQS